MLTSRLSPGLSRQSFFRLPPQLRVATYNHTQTVRSFSSTSSRPTNLVDYALAVPNGILDGVHALGVPWWAAIPTVALAVQGSLQSFRTDPNVIRHLIPVARVRSLDDEAKVIAKAGKLRRNDEPEILKLPLKFRKMYLIQRSMSRIKRRFKVPSVFAQAMLSNFCLIAFTESIRLKAGAPNGLLSELFRFVEWTAHVVNPNAFPSPSRAATPSPANLEQQMEAKFTAWEEAHERAQLSSTPDGETLAQTGQLPPTALNAPTQEPSTYLDPSLATEGALWLPNLTLPDPSLVAFPTALMALTAIPILTTALQRRRTRASAQATINPTNPLPAGIDPESPAGRTLSTPPLKPNTASLLTWGERIRLSITVLFCWILPHLPAGVALYFICSLSAGKFWRRLAEVRRPEVPTVRPCARPMRVQSRGEWHDF